MTRAKVLFTAIILSWVVVVVHAADFLVDTFTDTLDLSLPSHTPNTGGTWTLHASYGNDGLIVTNHNDIRHDPTATGLEVVEYNTATPNSAEYSVEVDLIYSTGTLNANHAKQVCGRIDTGSQTFYCAGFWGFDHGAQDVWILNRYVSGTRTELDFANVTLSAGTYTLRLDIDDATKKLFVNDVEVLSSADNTITAAGFAGIYSYFETDTDALHYDNYSAFDLEGGSPPSGPCFLLLLGVGC